MTPPPTPSVEVVLPVLNERGALPWVLERMPASIRPIVVDNGSTDGSAEVAATLGARVIHEPVRGFGSACATGMQAATADILCFMDADGSCDPANLIPMVAVLRDGEIDLVLGARDPEPGAWPIHARIANRYLARRLRRRFGWSVSDLGPMRAMRRSRLLELGLTDRRSGWPLEMALRAGAAGWQVSELTVPYRSRTGRSKVTGTLSGSVQAVIDMRHQLRAHHQATSGLRAAEQTRERP
jgi:glycosyltransferase involved in cell wall biosynthesis